MYKCKICGEEFEEDDDAMIHVGFGHKLIEDTEHPDRLTKEDFPEEFHALFDELEAKKGD